MVPIGLAANKQLMDAKFKLLTVPQTGEMYKAAYDAYYNLASAALNAANNSSVNDTDLAPVVEAQKQATELQLKADANKFAIDLCDGISKMLEEVSKQIDAHCKSMIINILTPAPGPGGTVLACAVGPVTGTVGANNLSPAGGITVS